MTIAPYPPMPDIIGSTTFKAAPTATAASKALPPSARIFRPACVASGWAELTMPEAPTAGLVGVLWLGVGLLARRVAVVDPVVSSPALSPREALSEVMD